MEPKLPQRGVITKFTFEGIGRIRLDDGTELKVGSVALKGVIDFSSGERELAGTEVLVLAIAPHPAGGLRAIQLERISKEVKFGTPTTPKAWDKQLRAIGLSPAHAKLVTEALRPAARLIMKKGKPKLGGSKIGGWPDVPADFKWPSVKNGALVFIAQIQLAELPKAVLASLELPKKGLLSLFLGPDPHCVLTVFDTPVIAFKSSDEPFVSERPLAIEEIWSTRSEAPFDDETAAAFYSTALADHRAAKSNPLHQVGGYPTPIHDSMENDEEAERLFIQLDHDEAIKWLDGSGFSWGDDGRLFVLASPGALETARFEVQD